MTTAGQPTSFKPEYCELAYNYCLLGATNEQLGTFLGVTRRTIFNWIEAHADFAKSVAEGRHVADARVARSLFNRAVGITQKLERTVLHEGEVKTLTDTRYDPPDGRACTYWLNNRQPEMWRRQATELRPERGPDLEALEAGAQEAARHAAD
jgi:hypothetical protein